jgi:hypothetical protein
MMMMVMFANRNYNKRRLEGLIKLPQEVVQNPPPYTTYGFNPQDISTWKLGLSKPLGFAYHRITTAYDETFLQNRVKNTPAVCDYL